MLDGLREAFVLCSGDVQVMGQKRPCCSQKGMQRRVVGAHGAESVRSTDVSRSDSEARRKAIERESGDASWQFLTGRRPVAPREAESYSKVLRSKVWRVARRV